MWYVMQVVGGKEHKVLRQVEKLVDEDAYVKCFTPSYELKKRYSGEWKLHREVLFPGYAFVETKTPEKFAAQLQRVPEMVRLLSSGEDDAGNSNFIPLTDEEKTLISAFTGNEDHVMKMSEGIIEGQNVVVMKGPLMNQEFLVKKIDRHKRLAYLDVPICGRTVSVKAGLEIVRKS